MVIMVNLLAKRVKPIRVGNPMTKQLPIITMVLSVMELSTFFKTFVC